MATYLIVGGAGYIGSHVAKQVIEQGDNIVILDNLSTGFLHTVETLQQYAIEKNVACDFYKVDLADSSAVANVFSKHHLDGVIHFAANLVVPESVANPLKYYINNTVHTTQLIKICVENNIKKFIFSSTAAVYGEPDPKDVPVHEELLVQPINPYGQSKLFSEKIIQDVAKAHTDFRFVILRYFNVAGADPDLLIGQSTENATQLIKVAAEVALGKRKKLSIYGTDYPTPDGTGVRDYIHVADLAAAHIEGLAYLDDPTHTSEIFNCGYGTGYSVKQVVETMKEVTGVNFTTEEVQRRPGDPSELIANVEKINAMTGWKPQYNDLALMCKSTFDWEKKLMQ